MYIRSPFRASYAIQPISLYAPLYRTKTYTPLTANVAAAQAILDASVAVSTAQASLAAPSIASMSSKSWWCIFFSKYLPFFLSLLV